MWQADNIMAMVAPPGMEGRKHLTALINTQNNTTVDSWICPSISAAAAKALMKAATARW